MERGTVTIITGPSGTGKSTLGFQFILSGIPEFVALYVQAPRIGGFMNDDTTAYPVTRGPHHPYPTVLLMVKGNDNRRLLLELLGDQYRVRSADDDDPSASLASDFDLCIIDGPTLTSLWKQVRDRREAEQPVFLPFLLVTPRRDVNMVTRHLWKEIDDLVLTPVEQAELMARASALLRARRFSLDQVTAMRQLANSREQIARLNAVLIAIRNIGYLVTRSRDAQDMAQGICDYLVKTRGYHSAWTVLFNDRNSRLTLVHSGLEQAATSLIEITKQGKVTACAQEALANTGTVIARSPTTMCQDCPLAESHYGHGVLVTCLEHEGKVYGLLNVAVPIHLVDDEQEHALFREIAADIAFAMHGLEIDARRHEAEESLRHAYQEMEARVRERTAELAATNERLRREIAERKKADAALRESEERYRDLVENLNDVIYVLDSQGIITYISPVVKSLTGCDASEIIGKHLLDLVPLTSHTDAQISMAQVLSGKIVVSEIQLTTKSGEMRWVRTSNRPIMQDGRVVEVRGVMTDITGRKQLEERLEAIYRLGRELTFIRDEDEIIRRVLKVAARVLRLDLVGFGLVDERSSEVVYTYSELQGRREPMYLRLPIDGERGISAAAAKSGQPLNVPDVTKDPRYVNVWQDLDVRSELCVPIKIGERVLGVLDAESVEPDHFTSADERLLQTLADQTAVAIENARLYQSLESQAERLASLNAIGTAITSSLELDVVMRQALSMTCKLLDATRGSILWLEESGELVFALTMADEEAILGGQRLPPGRGIAGWVAQHNQAVRVDDVNQDPRYDMTIARATGVNIKSLLCAPLRYHGNVIGVIEVINKRHGTFTDQDLETLEAVATVSATALENARLFDEQKRLLREREEAQAQLIYAEKVAALGRLAASLAHEINNPLQSVVGCLDLIHEGLSEGEDVTQYLDIAQDEVLRVVRIVNRMRDLHRPPSEEKSLTDINNLITQVLDLSKKRFQELSVEVVWEPAPNLPAISVIADQIKQVILNLILNALDAMPEGGILWVRTYLDDELRIEVADTGMGIAPEVLEHIFEPFYTTKPDGMGVGLSTSRTIIERHGGRIWVNSRPGKGTRFTIALPLHTLPDANGVQTAEVSQS